MLVLHGFRDIACHQIDLPFPQNSVSFKKLLNNPGMIAEQGTWRFIIVITPDGQGSGGKPKAFIGPGIRECVLCIERKFVECFNVIILRVSSMKIPARWRMDQAQR